MWSTIRYRFKRMDWRVRTVLATVAVSGIATILVGHYLISDQSKFFDDFFVGWASSVAFYALVGAAVAIVSLARPEEEGFESRARILFQRQSGSHIDYIVDKLRSVLEYYSLNVDRVITVLEYDHTDKKYFLSKRNTTKVRCYVDDTKTNHKSSMGSSEITPPPAGARQGKILFVKVGNKIQVSEKVIQGSEISVPYEFDLNPGEIGDLSYEMETWFQADNEVHSYVPIRYTQRVRLEVENRLDRDIKIKIRRKGEKGHKIEEQIIPALECRFIFEVRELRPDDTAYEMWICGP